MTHIDDVVKHVRKMQLKMFGIFVLIAVPFIILYVLYETALLALLFGGTITLSIYIYFIYRKYLMHLLKPESYTYSIITFDQLGNYFLKYDKYSAPLYEIALPKNKEVKIVISTKTKGNITEIITPRNDIHVISITDDGFELN